MISCVINDFSVVIYRGHKNLIQLYYLKVKGFSKIYCANEKFFLYNIYFMNFYIKLYNCFISGYLYTFICKNNTNHESITLTRIFIVSTDTEIKFIACKDIRARDVNITIYLLGYQNQFPSGLLIFS